MSIDRCHMAAGELLGKLHVTGGYDRNIW